MNTIKDGVTIHSWLIQINVMEVVVYGRIYVPNKTDDVNLNVFNLVTGINESKLLTKHISCECKYKFDGKKCGIMINVNVSAKI